MALLEENPCIESIQQALKHAIWEKTSHKVLGESQEWACYGIPLQLFLDNAWAHHSHSLENLARVISRGGTYNSIDLVFRPPYKGRHGAIIERLFRREMITTPPLDPSLDVSYRLANLRTWQAGWQHIDHELEEQVSHLDGNNLLQLQQSVHLSNVRRRMEMTDASKNRSPFLRVCSSTWEYWRCVPSLPSSLLVSLVRNGSDFTQFLPLFHDG